MKPALIIFLVCAVLFAAIAIGQITTNTAPKVVSGSGSFTVGHCTSISSTSPLQIQDNGVCPTAGGNQDPVVFGSIAACTSTKFQGQLTNSLYNYYWCDGSSTLHYYVGGWEVTPPTGFSWQNQSTATLTTTNGGELIKSAVGAAGANLNGRYVSYPSAPFTRTLLARIKVYTVSGHVGSNGQGGMYISDGTKVVLFGIYTVASGSASTQLIVQSGPTMTNITTNVSSVNQYASNSDFLWMRFNDGLDCSGGTSTGNRFYCYSYDGVTYAQFYTEANTVSFTSTRIGYFTNGFDTSTYEELWALGWQ